MSILVIYHIVCNVFFDFFNGQMKRSAFSFLDIFIPKLQIVDDTIFIDEATIN